MKDPIDRRDLLRFRFKPTLETGRRGEPEDVPLELDLARGELYRLLDALARAGSDSHLALVREFEKTWRRFREATAMRSRPAPNS